MTGSARGLPNSAQSTYHQAQAVVENAHARLERERARANALIRWGSVDETAWWIIDPNASWRAFWDALTAVLLLYLAFSVPYTVAFLEHDDFGFDLFQLIWFSIDIIISFCTPYEAGGLIVTNPKWIAFEYARTYLFIDLVSTFPFEMVFSAASASMSTTSKLLKLPRLMKTLRALKMTKLLRFYQVDEVLGQVQINFKIAPAAVSLCTLIFVALVVNHFFACIWYMLGVAPFDAACADGSYDRSRRQCTWMQVSGYSPRDGNWYLYTTCLYWSLTTVSTVGYGDISPHTLVEKLYTICVMITGVAGYAMLISSIGRLMLTSRGDTFLQTAALREYLYKREVPTRLSKSIFDYLHKHHEQAKYDADKDADVGCAIAALSKPLRRKLTLFTERRLIARTPWFDDRDAKFVADACVLLRPEFATPGEIVGAVACRAEKIYFVCLGAFAVFEKDRAHPSKRKSLSIDDVDAFDEAIVDEAPSGAPVLSFGERDHFGVPGVFAGALWKLDVTAVTDCEMNVLDGAALRALLDEPEHAALASDLEAEARRDVAAAPFLYLPPMPGPEGAAGSSTTTRRSAPHADAVDVAAFLRRHLPPDALDPAIDEPGAARVRGLVALGEAHASHADDADFLVATLAKTRRPDGAAVSGDAALQWGCLS